MNTTTTSGDSGETLRQRVGRYLLGVGGLCFVAAFYVAEYWRVALWLASVGIIVGYVGALTSKA